MNAADVFTQKFVRDGYEITIQTDECFSETRRALSRQLGQGTPVFMNMTRVKTKDGAA